MSDKYRVILRQETLMAKDFYDASGADARYQFFSSIAKLLKDNSWEGDSSLLAEKCEQIAAAWDARYKYFESESENSEAEEGNPDVD